MAKFNVRKYSIRTQVYAANKRGGARIGLAAGRSIVVGGKKVKLNKAQGTKPGLIAKKKTV